MVLVIGWKTSSIETSYHSHFAISHHLEVTTDTEVGSVSLEDRCSGVLQEVEFLVFIERNHASRGFTMILEVIREPSRSCWSISF